jgi:arginine deiminase
VAAEWTPLRAVLLHRPGPELESAKEAEAGPDAVLMLDRVDGPAARSEHEALAAAYAAAGVEVHLVDPPAVPPPNQMFVADLLFMTPEGAILARPASPVRAGEERWVARRLADLGIPILRSVAGTGTFEGADAAWLDSRTVLLGRGLRTNDEGAAQVSQTLAEQGVDTLLVDLPVGTMHLMGELRFLDRDLALAWPGRVAYAAVAALRERGYRVAFAPDESEARHGFALNFTTLGPRRVLMPAGNPTTQSFLEELGVECGTTSIRELGKAAGAIGCLTGVLWRDPPDA